MITWNDLLSWDQAPLHATEQACVARERKVQAISDDLFRAGSGMQSRVQTPEAIQGSSLGASVRRIDLLHG